MHTAQDRRETETANGGRGRKGERLEERGQRIPHPWDGRRQRKRKVKEGQKRKKQGLLLVEGEGCLTGGRPGGMGWVAVVP